MSEIYDELQPHLSELFRRLKHIAIAFVIVLLTVFMFNPITMTYGLTGSFTVYVFRLISQNIGGVKIIPIFFPCSSDTPIRETYCTPEM